MSRYQPHVFQVFEDSPEKTILSSRLHTLLAFHFSGTEPRSLEDERAVAGKWFPMDYAIGLDPYLVNPEITAGEINSGSQVLSWTEHGQWAVTQSAWAAFSWNPRVVYVPEVDKKGNITWKRKLVPFVASPQPTWQGLLDWADDFTLTVFSRRRTDRVGQVLKESRDALLAAGVDHPRETTALDPGAGLEHMPALTYLANRSAGAGIVHPKAVMRDVAGGTAEVWTEGDAHRILEGLADKTNTLESARNRLHVRHRAIEAIIKDPTGGLAAGATWDEIRTARLKALARLVDESKPEKIDALMLAEAAKIAREDDLPADLSLVKEVLVERLEARTMAKTKAIMKAATQQGIDRGASCVDEEKAVKAVARECVLGSIEIRKADNQSWIKVGSVWKKGNTLQKHTHEGEGDPKPGLGKAADTYVDTASGRKEAVAAFDAAVAEIEAVEVARVPVWKIGATVYAQGLTGVAATGRKLEVRAQQPAGDPAVPGGVAITGWRAQYADGGRAGSANVRTIKDLQNPATHCAEVTLAAAETKPVTVEIIAVNLCGPSTLAITLTPRSSP